MPVDFTTIIISAAVGGAAGSLLFFLSQHLERRARKKELLLSNATKLAVEKAHCNLGAVKAIDGDVGENCAIYYEWLHHLFTKGEPHPDAKLLQKG